MNLLTWHSLTRAMQDRSGWRTLRFNQKHKNSVRAYVQIYERWRRLHDAVPET